MAQHPSPQPKLSWSRTWSRPDGVSDQVLIAATIAAPTFDDIVRLCLFYGETRVRAMIEQMSRDGDIDALCQQIVTRMVTNASKGIANAQRRLAASNPGIA